VFFQGAWKAERGGACHRDADRRAKAGAGVERQAALDQRPRLLGGGDLAAHRRLLSGERARDRDEIHALQVL
jgi:hypothetical protein